MTSHIDIPQSSDVMDAADEALEERSEAQEDQSRIHPISHTYATSYESGSKTDFNSQLVEEVPASGDAPPLVEKVEDEGGRICHK